MKNINLLIAVVAMAVVALLVPGAQRADSATTATYCGSPHDSCNCTNTPNCISDAYNAGQQYAFSCCLPSVDAYGHPCGYMYPSLDQKYTCTLSCLYNGVWTTTVTDCDTSIPIPSNDPPRLVPGCPRSK